METDPKIPPFENNPPARDVPPVAPAPGTPGIAGPPPLAAGAAPAPPAGPKPNAGSGRKALAIVLSIFVALFLADALASLADDALSVLFGVHVLSILRGLVSIFGLLVAIVIYGMMGLTPMIPKRVFLPLTLFYLFAELAVIPFMIYYYRRIPEVVLGISICQVILAAGILHALQGGFKFRWPLVGEDWLGGRGFSWRNLVVFLLANIFLLMPAIMVYLFVCAACAAGHFSEGFLALRPGGITVQARKYVRNDGKTIELFPMLHVAESDFYRQVLQSFPTNSVILMEGVTDSKNLLTNKISYKRMATALGLGEQHQEFKPPQGEMVRADVDIDQFTTNTIDVLNLVMFIHSKGLNPETLLALLQFKQPPDLQEELFDDLLKKRNAHLLREIRARLSQSKHIVVPWGAAHMPGLAKEIQSEGFRLEDTQNYVAIRFHSDGNEAPYAKPK